MARILLVSTLAGVALSIALAWSLRSVVAYAADPAPQPRETAADHLRAGAEGCVRGGGTWWQGTEGEVVVGRCRPFLDLGVAPVAVRR